MFLKQPENSQERYLGKISVRSEKPLRRRCRWAGKLNWVCSLVRCLQQSAKPNDTFQVKLLIKFTKSASQLSLCSKVHGHLHLHPEIRQNMCL